MRFTTLFTLVFVLLAGGCSLLPGRVDETKDWTADRFYSEAKEALDDGDYETAIKYFESLEARYPFGRYAQQAQMEIIYAYYKYDEPASAVAAADRFIKLQPRHPNVDYAYYMKGLANYNQGKGLIDRYLPTDASQRDPGAARQSFQDFDVLVRRFPESKYANDARQRMVFLRNNLAAYELHVAEYYLRRGAYVAAANRAKYVVEHYQGAPVMPEALAMMVKSYRHMGMDQLANDALRILKENYPADAALAEVGR
jgi:outer membrane protein assembly factor BamD